MNPKIFFRCVLIIAATCIVMLKISSNTTNTYHQTENPIGKNCRSELCDDDIRHDYFTPPLYDNCEGEGMDEVCQYGTPSSNPKYAIISSTISGEMSLNYSFNLPLAALAWHRIGYDVIVVVVGDAYSCQKYTKAQYILETLQTMDFVVTVVLKGVTNHSVMFSQTSRMFGASLIRNAHDDWNDTFLVTSDADIWPVDGRFLKLPDDKDVLHDCLSVIKRFKTPVCYMPMTYVGMNVRTWLDVLTHFGELSMPGKPSEIFNYFSSYFGEKAHSEVYRAEPNWYMDQWMVSERLAVWLAKGENRTGRAHRYTYDRKVNRVNRPYIYTHQTLDNILDIHLRHDLYAPLSWKVIQGYIRLMYADETAHQWCDNYRDGIFNYSVPYCPV